MPWCAGAWTEPDLADLIPLVRAYCEFNGVERTDDAALDRSRGR